MGLNDSTINSGDNSNNNQAKTIIINQGFGYEDIRKIALDLFNDNFTKMRDEAAKIVADRASEVTDKLIDKLRQEAQETINQFSQPDMQYKFYEAQKEYAISGDEDLADMLVEMLIERSRSPNRDRKRMILDEGISLASKMTTSQMDILSLSHLSLKTLNVNMSNFEGFISRLETNFSFLNYININDVDKDLNFLEFHRLGKVVIGSFPDMTVTLVQNYPNYLNHGFFREECSIPEIGDQDIFIRCFHDPKKVLFQFETRDSLINYLKAFDMVDSRINKVVSFFDDNIFSVTEANSILFNRITNYKKLDELFKNTNWKSFEISEVGMAIALSNIQRRLGQKHDLGIWVNSKPEYIQ